MHDQPLKLPQLPNPMRLDHDRRLVYAIAHVDAAARHIRRADCSAPVEALHKHGLAAAHLTDAREITKSMRQDIGEASELRRIESLCDGLISHMNQMSAGFHQMQSLEERTESC